MRLTVLERQRKILLSMDVDEAREVLRALAFKHEVAVEYGEEDVASRLCRLIRKIEAELEAQGVEI